MPENNGRNALAELAEFLKEESKCFSKSEEFKARAIAAFGEDSWKRYLAKKNKLLTASRIVAELAKVNHGEASPTPWRAHTDREVRANDERLWIEGVVCQTQSCPKTRYTKAEREEWNIPATANTKLIVASVNAVAECRAIAEEGSSNG